MRILFSLVAATFSCMMLLACSGDSPIEPPPPPPPDPSAQFDIDIRPVPGLTPTPEQQQVIDEAVARWESVIVDDLPPVQVSRSATLCERVAAPAMEEEVDDLVVWLDVGPLDGPGGAVAWGGVCELRSSLLPSVGSILVDEADGVFVSQVIIHEIGHALGFGEVWHELGLLGDPSSPGHGGPGLLEPVADATVSSGAPDDNFGVGGASDLSSVLVVGTSLGEWTEQPDDTLLAFLRYDIGGFAFQAPIEDAVLLFHDSASVGAPQRVLIGTLGESWNEASVTWNSQPSLVDTLTVFEVDPGGCEDACVVSGNVRELVEGWLDGGLLPHGLALFIEAVGQPTYGIGFHSRHHPDPERRPALYIQPSSYFTGPHARAAYLEAGGDPSSSLGVPLENRYRRFEDSVDSHWHPVLVMNEVMGTTGGGLLSTITVGALADMGYGVDYAAADGLVIDQP